MLTFHTPTSLPIEAATTMGVSVKEKDGAIGKFGTGLKYAIAGILRLNGSVSIIVDGQDYVFTARPSDIRGKTFNIVHCNGAPCGFTTELGKHWEPWQLFRELASNTLDEGGTWNRPHSDDGTLIKVSCREVEESERTEQVFLAPRPVLVRSTNGATIYEGPSKHYYFNGIRAGSFDEMAPVTVNVCNGYLSEDRLLDRATVIMEMSWAFRTATYWDSSLLLEILPINDRAHFWVKNLCEYNLAGELPKDMLAFLADRPKFVCHPGFSAALKAYQKKGGISRWEEVPQTDKHRSLLSAGEAVCARAGVDLIPREKVHFTQDLSDDQLAVTCMDTREVWFSTKLALLGRDEFMAGYLEEALHAMTGFQDCTRNFQNAMLAMIVSLSKDD